MTGATGLTALATACWSEVQIVPSNKLTDHQIKSAKPREKAYKLFDGGGMFAIITPAGGKHWRLQYRLNGKQQTMSLGAYPGISLKDARIKAQAAREEIAGGVVAKRRKNASKGLSDAVIEYWANRQDITAGYRRNAIRAMAMHIEPDLGDRELSSITRDDLMACFNRMNAAGLFVYVRKTRMWLACLFDWAIEHGYAEINHARLVNPKKAFGNRPVENHAHLSAADLPDFLERLSLERELNSVLALKLLMLTWVRTKELRAMRWGEVSGDTWTVPADRMKRRRDHIIPLSYQARAILEKMRARSVSNFVFPNDRRLDRPMSENAILFLIGRIGYKNIVTGHGFRTTASTWANENLYNPDAIEMQLSHSPSNRIRGIYNKAEYMDIRRSMLQDYSNWIDHLLSSTPVHDGMPASLVCTCKYCQQNIHREQPLVSPHTL